MAQYFDNVEGLRHRDLSVEFTLFGERYHLDSDDGVFSKNRLDEGTRLLLETIGKDDLGTKILDVGCGAGPIGLILARLDPKRQVTLCDVNERALILSRKNALSLGVASQVEIVNSDVYLNIPSIYDTIVSNPPIRAGKKVTYRIYDEASSHLGENGKLILVIRKQQGADSVRAHLETLFSKVCVRATKKGYRILIAQK